MSILEEGTNSTEIPMMGVFNNLVMYDQHVAQNSLSLHRAGRWRAHVSTSSLTNSLWLKGDSGRCGKCGMETLRRRTGFRQST